MHHDSKNRSGVTCNGIVPRRRRSSARGALIHTQFIRWILYKSKRDTIVALVTVGKPSSSRNTPVKRMFNQSYITCMITMLWTTLLLLLLLIPTCHAACLSEEDSPTMREQFETSELVGRFKLVDPSQQMMLPCGILVWTGIEYSIIDELNSYQVVELFKGSVDSEIPIVWWTDTGYRQAIPSYFTEDDEGFLAVMNSYRTCQNDTNFWMYEDDYEPIPYEMGECSYSNQPWSEVSEEDKAWLRAQASASDSPAPSTAPVLGGDDGDTPAPSSSPNDDGDTSAPTSDGDEVAPTPLADVPATPTPDGMFASSSEPSGTTSHRVSYLYNRHTYMIIPLILVCLLLSRHSGNVFDSNDARFQSFNVDASSDRLITVQLG